MKQRNLRIRRARAYMWRQIRMEMKAGITFEDEGLMLQDAKSLKIPPAVLAWYDGDTPESRRQYERRVNRFHNHGRFTGYTNAWGPSWHGPAEPTTYGAWLHDPDDGPNYDADDDDVDNAEMDRMIETWEDLDDALGSGSVYNQKPTIYLTEPGPFMKKTDKKTIEIVELPDE